MWSGSFCFKIQLFPRPWGWYSSGSGQGRPPSTESGAEFLAQRAEVVPRGPRRDPESGGLSEEGEQRVALDDRELN